MGELLLNSYEADRQEYYRRRMDSCLEAVKRPPPLTDSYGDVSRAAKEAQGRMGIAQKNGNAFRQYGVKRKP